MDHNLLAHFLASNPDFMRNPTYSHGGAFATAPEQPNLYLRTAGHEAIKRKIADIVASGSVQRANCRVMITFEGSVRTLSADAIKGFASDLLAIMSSGNIKPQAYLRAEIVCGPEGIGQRVKAYNPLFDNDWTYDGGKIDKSMLVHFYLVDDSDKLQVVIQRPQMGAVADAFISQRCRLYVASE
jgi:hypothetical protein